MTAAGQDRLARAAAALRPHLPRYADYELEALARVVLDAAAEPARQDGELVTGRVHELKTWPKFYAAVESGEKTFELRKDDRGFRVGDVLRLREWEPVSATYSGRECRRRVTFVLDLDAWLDTPAGFVVLALAAVALDLDRAGYDRARQECADKLRKRHYPTTSRAFGQKGVMVCKADRTYWPCPDAALADRWSSGRAPAGKEGQR